MIGERYKGIINGDCDTVLQKMVDDGVKYDLNSNRQCNSVEFIVS